LVSETEKYVLNAEMIPTPKPAKKRPATKRGIAAEAVCNITPKQKTTKEIIRASFLPRKSARGAAAKAPKNVPADKMETIREYCAAVISGRPVSGFL
jgi:hypothetical protein